MYTSSIKVGYNMLPLICLGSLIKHKGAVLTAEFTKDGEYCLTSGTDRCINLWNPQKLLHIKEYRGYHNHEIKSISIFQDNSKFVSVGGDRMAFLWDVTSGQTIRKFIGHNAPLNSSALSFNDEVLCTTSNDHSAKLWDIRSFSKQPIQTLSDFSDNVTSVSLTEYEAIFSSLDGTIKNFDLRKGLMTEDKIFRPIISLALSRDTDYILISCLDKTIRLIEKCSGDLIACYTGHICENYNINACLDPSDSFVVSGSEDGNIYIWDLLSGSLLDEVKFKKNKGTKFIKEHLGPVFYVTFHPIHRLMLSCSNDKTIKVWTPQD